MNKRSPSARSRTGKSDKTRARIAELETALASCTRSRDLLRAEWEHFKMLADDSPDMIFIHRNGRIVYANRKCSALTGFTPEELSHPSFDFRRLIAPESSELIRRDYQDHLEGRDVAPHEYTLITKEGGRITGLCATRLLQHPEGVSVLGTITDITRHKQEESDLHDIAEKQQLVLDNIEELVYVARSPDGPMDQEVIQFISGNVRKITGCEPQEILEDPALWFRLIHPDDIDRLSASTRELYATGNGATREYRVLHREDNRYRWIEDRAVPRRDATGRIVGLFGVARDITGRKLVEEQLRASEQRYRMLFEENPYPMWVFDRSTLRFLAVNDAAVSHYGYSREEFLSLKVTDIRPPEDVPRLMENLALNIEGIDRAGIWRHLKKDGTVIDVEITSHRISFEGRDAELVLSVDITERLRAERAAEESKLRYREVVEQAVDIIFTVDDAGNFTYANPAALQNSGYSLEELLSMSYLDVVLPEFRTRMSRHYLRQTLEKTPVTYTEFPFRTKTGHVKWYGQNTTLLMEEGRVRGYHVIARDITERKEIEEQLRLSNEILSRVGAIVLVSNLSGEITYASPSVERVLGFRREELLGDGWWRMTRDDASERERERERVRRISQGMAPIPSEPYERLVKDRNGEEHWILWQDSKGPGDTLIGVGHDITERKRSQEELYRSRQMLQFVLDNIPQRVFWKDREFRYLGCNLPFARDAGLRSPEDIIGKDDFELTWVETAHLYRADDRLVMETNTVKLGFEEPQTTKEGEQRWLLTSKMPLRDRDGNVLGILGTYEDMTERRKSEEAQRRLLQAVEHTDEVIFMTDASGVITYTNPAFQRVYGYTREEVLGKTPRILKSGRWDQRTYADFWNTILAGHSLRGEIVNKTKAGALITVQSTVSPVYVGDRTLIGFIAIQEDITARKQSEEHIRELATLLDIASDAIIVIDLQGAVTFWSKGAERLYGWTAEEAVGNDCMALLDQGHFDPSSSAVQRTLEHGAWNGELHQTTRKRQSVTVESRWTLMKTPQGTAHRILIVNTDVTERKLLEAQFYRAQRLESLGTLASGIAHDLNNVFTPIMIAADLLKAKLSDPAQLKLTSTIEKGLARGKAIVEQVLGFARGMAGERKPVRLDSVVREIQHIVAETFPRSIGLKSHVDPNLWTVEGDSTQFHQILMNLCVNARDAMPSGGVLEINVTNRTLTEADVHQRAGVAAGPYVVLTVRDTGIGIPPENMEKIFDPFFTTKETGKGTGLGLATVHTIVKNARGFITVESEPGQGTAFHVYFPATGADAAETISAASPEVSASRGEQILIVDDEEDIRLMLTGLLEAEGYHVHAARDGTEAVALYAQHRNDIRLVLTDLMMPHMDGRATVRALRRLNASVKILATSGVAEQEDREELTRDGVAGFLQKPFNKSSLLNTIRRALE